MPRTQSRYADAITSRPIIAISVPSMLTVGQLAYLFLKSRNERSAQPLSRSKLLEANMKNRFERAGVTDAFANLLSELKHDLRDAAKSKSVDARESLATVLDDVADKVRYNARRASSHLRHSNSHTHHNGSNNLGKVALVLGVAGLVGVLFAAGASHDETTQPNA
jgi:hypothetical protein